MHIMHAPPRTYTYSFIGTDHGLPDEPLSRFAQDKGARSPTGERVKVIHGTNHDEGVLFMATLPFVVRGVGPGGYTGLLTDADVDLIYNDLISCVPSRVACVSARARAGECARAACVAHCLATVGWIRKAQRSSCTPTQ